MNFESIWEKKEIEIEIETDIEEEVFIDSDGELLALAWNNLFSNAMKFTERGGRVSVILKSDDRYAVVQVSDTGCGIDPGVGRHIFEKFYQGDASHSTQGNGLGLALVIFVLVTEKEGAIAYLSYFMSAYALVITCTGIAHVKRLVKSFRAGIGEHPLTKKLSNTALGARLLNDVRFRTEISLYLGFGINLLYIVMKMASGIYYHSIWFISVAVYYILLAIMRFLLFRRGKTRTAGDHPEEELKRYRMCGILLLLMNQALAGIAVFMVHRNKSYDYPGILIYAMAAYSFIPASNEPSAMLA